MGGEPFSDQRALSIGDRQVLLLLDDAVPQRRDVAELRSSGVKSSNPGGGMRSGCAIREIIALVWRVDKLALDHASA